MNENIKWFAAAVAVVGASIGAVLYFGWKDRNAEPEKAAVILPAPEPLPAAPEPEIKHPVPVTTTDTPLPKLAESDGPVQAALGTLLGPQAVEQFVITDDLVRHMVVTIDNLTSEKVAQRIRPLQPTPGPFAVQGEEDALLLDPANYERYKPLITLIRTSDTKQLIAAYSRYYPLFQEAYESQGHPPKYFNDRLIEVIDHLLATPEPEGTIPLARPGVQYQYADAKLESSSAGQKVLLRMGNANAREVKAKLSELREALIARQEG